MKNSKKYPRYIELPIGALKKFYDFLKEDSLPSLIVTLVLAFIIIKFIFFPLLSFVTGTSLPLVIVESCSMHHPEDWEEIFNRQGTCENGQTKLRIDENSFTILEQSGNYKINKIRFERQNFNRLIEIPIEEINVGNHITYTTEKGEFTQVITEIKNNTYFTRGNYYCQIEELYNDYNISLEEAKSFHFRNGLNKGDIVFVLGPKNIEKGDVIIFNAGASHPVIHRTIKITDSGIITTKGDNNNGILNSEKSIFPENVLGKAVFKIPYAGWIKLIFFEHTRREDQRGFC